MDIGFVARCDNGGLGIMSKYFVKHIKPSKIMSIIVGGLTQFPDRFPNSMVVNGVPTEEQIRNFLNGLDLVFTIETPYNWEMFRIAREMGVKSILCINYEWLAEHIYKPDLYLNPVDWFMEKLPDNSLFIPFPVDREVHKFRLRKRARTFLHVVGHGGAYGRNGTDLVLKAIPLVKSDVKFIIHSQVDVVKIDDPRIEYRLGNYMHEAEMYKDADVLLYPRLYAGQSLPMNEAMSNGLMIMMSDMRPQNKFLPPQPLIPVKNISRFEIKQEIERATIDPLDIAMKIDEFANCDITSYSKLSGELAEKISWETLAPKYYEIFSNLIN